MTMNHGRIGRRGRGLAWVLVAMAGLPGWGLPGWGGAGAAWAGAGAAWAGVDGAVDSPAGATTTEPGPWLLGHQPRSTEDLAWALPIYRQHLETLSNPFFEGRAPGTRGNRLAADYMEFTFRQLGLTPAFPARMGTIPPGEAPAPGSAEEGAFSTYRQVFVAPRGALRPGEGLDVRSLGISATTREGEVVLEAGKDFVPLGLSGNGKVTGPLAFAGYSILRGENDYTSYPELSDLTGKIAIVLRFEPMKEDGTSRWTDQGWSFRAGLEAKLRAAVSKGAAGIILVNPPGAQDRRTGTLEGLALGGSVMGVPVVQMTPEAADRLVRGGDRDGRSLEDLRKIADETGGVQDLAQSMVTLEVGIERTPVYTDNVGAVLRGRGALADQYIVIGGHYDHVGYGYFGTRGLEERTIGTKAYTETGLRTLTADDASARGVIHPGADDNASGTSAVLLLARMLSEAYAAAPADANLRSVLFLGFSAEESGLNGARHYVENPIAPLDRHYLMINLDMIGRLRERPPMEVGGVGSGEGLDALLSPYLDAFGMPVIRRRSGQGPSDHATFDAAGVPVLFFFTGLHDQYHRPSDTANTINVEGVLRIAELVERFVREAASREQPMPHARPAATARDGDQPQPMGGVRVRFGIMPDSYGDDVQGVLLGDVFPGTSAAEAGLQKGDIMTAWNGTPITSVDVWMPMLREHNPGDKVTITYTRNGEVRTTEATLQGRGGGRQ